MTTTDVSLSATPVAPSGRWRRRWYWLFAGIVLLAGGGGACEGWAAWQEHLAAQALAEDRMDAARQHIERALQVRRHRVSTLLLAARIRRLRGGYSDAEQYLQRCSQIEGMSEPVQLEWMLLRCQEGEVDELAPQLFALVKHLHPQSPAILETLASIYLRQTRYLEAALALNLWLEQAPDSVRALDWRGWVNVQLDHREQAIRDYEHLLELQPQRTDIRLRLAQVLVESQRHPKAVPHLERLLREQPGDPDVVATLAPCRIQEGRIDEAKQMLDTVLQDHPEHFDALFQRGKLEITLGHPAEAEVWLRKALQVKPHHKEARYNLYRSLQGQPNRQQEAERELARWEQEDEKLDRLTSLLRKYLAANPNDVDLACEAGRLLLEIGEEQRGLFWLHRALTLNPRHLPSRRVLLAHYEQTNQPDKAEEQRRQLAELQP
jgi:tetratricopeptide (TPR) repeat protein